MSVPASSVSNDQVVELFKRVYGDMRDLVPDDQLLAKDIEWDETKSVGDRFIEDVVLGAEVGITFGGSGQDAFEINAAIAGAVKQIEVKPYVSILPSILPFATISRSAGGGEKAFMAASKFIVRNNLKSHNDILEIMRLYGQSSKLLGYVSYASQTYRNAAFATGTGTINGVTFTNGINAASKLVLFKPGDFASGIWVGKKGIKVKQLDATGAVVAAGKLVSVNSAYGYIGVDFTPVAASSTTSHRICFDGQEGSGEMIGMHKILSTQTGSLFGLTVDSYELFKGNNYNMNGKKLTLVKLNEIVADAVNAGGLDEDVVVYVNPRTWSTCATTEAGLRVYDKSYDEGKARQGFRDLEFFTQSGKMTIKSHRKVMEGDAFVTCPRTWHRSGSARVGFRVPGMEEGAGDLIRALENQAGYQFKSYSDEYMFCPEPVKNILISSINDEAAA